jgi:hypothetical protein
MMDATFVLQILLPESRTMEVLNAIGYLLGSWRVERRIDDHRNGVSGAFRGSATFVRLEDDSDASVATKLRYREVGELNFGAHSGKSQRSLEYVSLEGAKVQIHFSDGRHFIDLDLSRGPSRSVHPCNLDQYEISFFARSNDVLEESWRVQGPAKDYEATTTLTRER